MICSVTASVHKLKVPKPSCWWLSPLSSEYILVVSACSFQWTYLAGVPYKAFPWGTVAASCSALSWHVPFCLCVAFLSHGLLLLSEFSLQWLFRSIVLSFTATYWPLQKSSYHSTWLHPALHERAHSDDRLLDSGLWHRWVKTGFLSLGRLRSVALGRAAGCGTTAWGMK